MIVKDKQLKIDFFILTMAYLLGSVSFAVLITRIKGLDDPRSYGSKNPGATNILRSGRKLLALFTLLGDMAKGAAAVYMCQLLSAHINENTIYLAGCAAFLGHLYPVFFQFKGGKGVATALGVFLAYHPILGLATALTWLIVAYFFRYSSLAAIVAALFAIFYNALLFGVNLQFGCVALICFTLIYKHKKNIKNLFLGTETKIGQQ